MAAEEPGPLPRTAGPAGLPARRWGSRTDASALACPSERGASHTGASLLAADLAVLRDSGYLKLALPARFGGAGLSLADLACAQRQLAARAPATAWAVNAHHAWIGAAADALATGAGPGGPAGPGCWARPPGAGYWRATGRRQAGTGRPGGGWTQVAGLPSSTGSPGGRGELPAGGPSSPWAGRAAR